MGVKKNNSSFKRDKSEKRQGKKYWRNKLKFKNLISLKHHKNKSEFLENSKSLNKTDICIEHDYKNSWK